MYADDMVYISLDPVEFQQGINVIEQYCNLWNLKINVNKSKVIVFRKSKIAKLPVFVYGTVNLENVDSMDYLGITFVYNGGWFINGKNRMVKAKRAIYALRQKCYKF